MVELRQVQWGERKISPSLMNNDQESPRKFWPQKAQKAQKETIWTSGFCAFCAFCGYIGFGSAGWEQENENDQGATPASTSEP